MKKLLLSLFIFLALSNLVFALEIETNYDSKIMVRGVDSKINLELIVNNATHGNYNLYTLSDISILPAEIFVINNDYFLKKFVMRARDNLDVEGNYAFTYTLNHRGVEKFDKRFIIDFVNLEDIISIGSESVDFETGQIDYYIQNEEDVDIENLSVKFSSILFEDEMIIDLGSKEKKVFSVFVDPSLLKKTVAGDYIIGAVFDTSFGKVNVNGNLYLGERKGIKSTEDSSGFLIRTHTITKINAGNVAESVNVYATQDIFSRFFTSFSQEPDLVERDGFYVSYTWNKDRLSPSEIYVVKMKTNYILLFSVVAVIFVIFLLIKKYNETKIEIKKKVSYVKTKTGEFALRIYLEVKARKSVENVVLSDRVPTMVKIYNKFDDNNKPHKVDSRSRSLHWKVGDLISGESKIYSYIVYSKVGIVGKFVLPEAKATFERDSKKHRAISNKVYFMSEQGN